MTDTRTETIEERYNRLLREAISEGKRMRSVGRDSLSHSISMNELEIATLWSSKDMVEKGFITPT